MKKHLSLIIALSIPVLMIIFVAASIYIPRLFFKPDVKFVYTTGYNNNLYQDHYQIIDHKIQKVPAVVPNNDNTIPTPKYPPVPSVPSYPALYLYDATTDTSKEITFAESQSYTLDSNFTSPEGYTVTHGNSNGGIFEIFGGYNNDYNSWYLKNGSFSKKITIHINSPDRYYYGDFGLLGWIIN